MRWTALSFALTLVGLGCSHAQRSERRAYVISEDARGVGSALGSGGSGGRDCQAEHEACFRRCWEKSRPKYPHKHGEWYYKRCTSDCREEFNRCEEEQENEAAKRVGELKFSRVDEAVEWLKNHKTEVVLGTVVVVAGVAFIVTTGGSGALVLAPLAL